jgi:hypothetical protein
LERIIFKKNKSTITLGQDLYLDESTIMLSEEIYLVKNFINKDQITKYLNQLESFEESDWHKHENVNPGDLEGDFWDGKLSLDILDTSFHDQVLNYFSPHGFWPYGHMNFVRLKPGQSSEINGLNVEYIKYKLAIYLGDWTGGEIYFPDLDIEYKPENNDLLVIKCDEKHKHLTKPVLSGNRYAYIDFLVEHPGYFMP